MHRIDCPGKEEDVMVKGRIHSMDTFGTVDGPGIRFVLFMQGCALRCQFCHNPDTWKMSGGKQVTVEEVLAEIEPYISYYQRSGGGITVTGGEPTLQAPFVARLFRECKRRWGLHTALDSSGFCDPAVAAGLLDATDLVLLDLKQMDAQRHKQLTGQRHDRIHRFARHLAEIGKPLWVRHVLIPGITDDPSDLRALGSFVSELGTVEKLELLPYHRMGVYKWLALGLDYPLDGVPEPETEEVERARLYVEKGRSMFGGQEAVTVTATGTLGR